VEGLGDLEALYTAHSDALYRYAMWLVHDEAAAEDLIQETFLRAYEKRDQFHDRASRLTWLRRILHNLAIDRHRRSSREIPVAAVEDKWREDSYTVDTEAVVERAQDREELEDALVRLPFIYRATLVLHDAEGLPTTEIAEILSEGVPAIKQRLRRGRMMLVSSLASGHERRVAMAGVPMKCWDARIKVSDYLDGELPDREAKVLEEHLGRCPTCPPLYAALVGIRDRLGAMRDPNKVVPPHLADRIARRLDKSQ
jgi:RNA polymerase sigma-70 factor (ECF subfamily)